MANLIQSQVFFFIFSVGFIILGVLVVAVLIYILRALRLFSKILEKAEKDIDSVGETTKEIFEEIQDSPIFRLLFRVKRRHKEANKHK